MSFRLFFALGGFSYYYQAPNKFHVLVCRED